MKLILIPPGDPQWLVESQKKQKNTNQILPWPLPFFYFLKSKRPWIWRAEKSHTFKDFREEDCNNF